MKEIELIQGILEEYQSILLEDREKYCNHCLRVFLYCRVLDQDEINLNKYAIAATFHDIGIWKNKTFDYLNPSIEEVKTYLNKIQKSEWIEEISTMIDMHHKAGKYKGANGTTVETFRKADWIDVTGGLMKFKIEKEIIRRIQNYFPNKGFHKFLMFQFFKNLLKNPLNPLPMFRM